MLEIISYWAWWLSIITWLLLLSVVFLYFTYIWIKELSQFYYWLAVMMYRLNKMTINESRILKICYQSIVLKDKDYKKIIDDINNFLNK